MEIQGLPKKMIRIDDGMDRSGRGCNHCGKGNEPILNNPVKESVQLFAAEKQNVVGIIISKRTNRIWGGRVSRVQSSKAEERDAFWQEMDEKAYVGSR